MTRKILENEELELEVINLDKDSREMWVGDRHGLQWAEVKEIGEGRTVVHKPVFVLYYRACGGMWGS